MSRPSPTPSPCAPCAGIRGFLAVSAVLYTPSELAQELPGTSPISASHFRDSTGLLTGSVAVHLVLYVGLRGLTQVVRHGKRVYKISCLTDLQHMQFKSTLV